MSNTHQCNRCGHQHALPTAFCHECGESLRKFFQQHGIALIEGTAGIGKTTLVDNLLRHHLQQNPHVNTFLRLGQGHTYGPLDPDAEAPQVTYAEQLAYLERIYQTLAFLSRPHRPESRPPFSCIIETLHLTLASKPHRLAPTELAAYDEKLAAIGCKLIFIHVTPDTLWERCIWERRQNGFITIYGQKYGASLEEIHAHYVAEQERMLALFEESQMEKLLIVGEQSPRDLTNLAYAFWHK